jgi:hypothetical protein
MFVLMLNGSATTAVRFDREKKGALAGVFRGNQLSAPNKLIVL